MGQKQQIATVLRVTHHSIQTCFFFVVVVVNKPIGITAIEKESKEKEQNREKNVSFSGSSLHASPNIPFSSSSFYKSNNSIWSHTRLNYK